MAEQDYINRLAAMEKSIRDDLDEVDAFQMETADGVESEPENRSQRVSVLTNPLELPPVLKTLDPKDIVNFKRAYTRYQENFKDVQIQGGAGANLKPKSLQSMIQPHLWMTIYEFHFTDAEKANGSDAILAFLDRQLKVDQSHSHAVEFIMSTELKINVHLKPRARITDLLCRMNKVIEDHQLSDMFSSTRGVKNYINFIVAALRPASFRLAMESALEFHKTQLEDNKQLFVQELFDTVDRYETDLLREKHAMDHKRSRIIPSSDRDGKKKLRAGTRCLKCHSPDHHMKDCPKHPSDIHQKKLIAEYRMLKKYRK